MKVNKRIFAPIIALLCVILYAVFAKPAIETRTWVLTMAQQVEPFFVVAHKTGYDFSNDDSSLFVFSKEIELVCVAKDGKLTITDNTNDITYEGTYQITSWSKFSGQRYAVVIDGKEGTANVSSRFNRTLFKRTLSVSIDGYYLNFEVQ